MKTKNVKKGESYKYAFERMPEAIEGGYFLEAITIAESIINDRLQSFVIGKDVKGRGSFGDMIKGILNHVPKMDEETLSLVKRLKPWKDLRNECIHGIAKSHPGQPTIDVDAFHGRAEEVAESGYLLAKEVTAWHKKSLRAGNKVF